ncbi:15336_t:CDS:1, partial [Racocetra fulgida]
LEEIYQEILVYQPFGMITFSTFGLLTCNNTGQETNITLLDLLVQPGFTKDIELNISFLLDTQTIVESLEVPIKPVNTTTDLDFD